MENSISLLLMDIETRSPLEGLSAVEMGHALGGIGDEAVRQRERAGKLFSMPCKEGVHGREYPAFQAWVGVQGEPLEAVLMALSTTTPHHDMASVAYGFFAGMTDLLSDLTPIEALIGKLTARRELGTEVQAFLASPETERLKAVLDAAQAHVAAVCAW